MHGRTRTRIVARGAALVTMLGALISFVGPAAATTDAALGNAIAITPPAGWVMAPASEANEEVAQQEQTIGETVHVEFTAASKEWTQPNSTNQLTVTLLAYTPAEIAKIESAVDSEKASCVAGQSAVTSPVSGIPQSKEIVCTTASTNGTAGTYGRIEVGWFTVDTYATVNAIGLPSAQVASYARQVARTIPTGGFSASTGSSSGHLPLIAAGAAVIVLGAVALFALHRRRAAVARRPPVIVTRQPTEAMPPLPPFRPGQAAAPSVAPGWHPLPDDPTKTAYWDGTRWAAYRQWDGQQWVDAAVAQR
jgi:hypothetical protein